RALASPRIVCGSRICPLRASVPAAAPARSRWVMPCGRLASRDRRSWAVTAPPPSRRRSRPRWQRTRRRSKHATAASGDEPGAAASLPLGECSLGGASVIGSGILETAIRLQLRVVQPATILRWHRAGFRAYWRWKSRGRPGRPRVSRELRELIQRMSKENPLWGAPRIHGELLKLGFEIAESTV